jgi:hypothetical protein
MLRAALASVSLLAMMASASAVDLTVVNQSKYTIHQLYVALSKSKKWGSDQLGNHSVGPNEQFTVRNIPEGTYDLKFVDEDDDSCVVSGIQFDHDKQWTITNEAIDNCDEDDN